MKWVILLALTVSVFAQQQHPTADEVFQNITREWKLRKANINVDPNLSEQQKAEELAKVDAKMAKLATPFRNSVCASLKTKVSACDQPPSLASLAAIQNELNDEKVTP